MTNIKVWYDETDLSDKVGNLKKYEIIYVNNN